MKLDLNGIHALAQEQGIDAETVDAALSEALRLAYLKMPQNMPESNSTRAPAASPSGLVTRFLRNPPKTIRTPLRNWARSTMTPRMISAVWRHPRHAR